MEQHEFSVDTVVDDGVFRVWIGGELDMATAAMLAEVASEPPSDAQTCEVDMSEVTFMDSSGLHALLSARTALRARSMDMRLVAVSAPVARLLDLAGLADGFARRAS